MDKSVPRLLQEPLGQDVCYQNPTRGIIWSALFYTLLPLECICCESVFMSNRETFSIFKMFILISLA